MVPEPGIFCHLHQFAHWNPHSHVEESFYLDTDLQDLWACCGIAFAPRLLAAGEPLGHLHWEASVLPENSWCHGVSSHHCESVALPMFSFMPLLKAAT